jgi:glyoxylase-like metal-dependent hydrolase (beta-lactamase superfamily II)
MHAPIVMDPRIVAPDTTALTAWLPVPGFGVLPVSAFVIRAKEPILVDTGVAGLREMFLDALRATIDPAELRWIWLTHTDPDHAGNLAEVLQLAPNARLVTTFLGMAKLGLLGLPTDRVWLLNPGQELDVGDRRLQAARPATYDAPETTGFLDRRSGALFCADSFGALAAEPVESADAMQADALRQGMLMWAPVDAPWLSMVAEGRFSAALAGVKEMKPSAILSSRLPPASGILMETLLHNLEAARSAPAFVGPDQAALEQMMAAAA